MFYKINIRFILEFSVKDNEALNIFGFYSKILVDSPFPSSTCIDLLYGVISCMLYIWRLFHIFYLCSNQSHRTALQDCAVHFNANLSGMFALYLMCIFNLGCIKINVTFSCAVHS